MRFLLAVGVGEEEEELNDTNIQSHSPVISPALADVSEMTRLHRIKTFALYKGFFDGKSH